MDKRMIKVLEDLIKFSEECFDDANYNSDIVLSEQDEYKNAGDLLRELQIKRQNERLHK